MNEIRTLNVEQACEMLHTHKSTLYQKIASGEIHKQFFNLKSV